MTRNPIFKVLSVFRKNKVKSLLIGGQACILYGAVEFSRDTDFVILCNSFNLEHIRKALSELNAERIYVPPCELAYLLKGHAVHFICQTKETEGLRVDIMGRLRGCDDFEELWKRRTTVKINSSISVEIISLEDLVQSKKTQRDKDWFMLKRLVDNDIYLTRKPPRNKIIFWLKECRTIENLHRLCAKYTEIARFLALARPLLKYVLSNKIKKTQQLLTREEEIERKEDRQYWEPLRKELEILRHKQIH